ncbi:hypothetical protein BGX26_001520 [Mortierella sp. AD094]|nr:hypothetical protein BGX26_001520 [Mortierella sp. AD094]
MSHLQLTDQYTGTKLYLNDNVTVDTVVTIQISYDALVSGALFVGSDASTAVSNHNSVCRSTYNNSTPETFADPRNHVIALSSILWSMALQSNFTPARHLKSKGVIDDPAVFGNFLERVLQFPGFKNRFYKTRELRLSGDLLEFEEKIEEQYEAQMAHPHAIAVVFRNLIPLELPSSGDDNTFSKKYHRYWLSTYRTLHRHHRYSQLPFVKSHQTWLLSHIVIYNEPGVAPSFELSRVRLTISRDSRTGKALIDRQVALIEQSMFSVEARFLIENAVGLTNQIPTVSVGVFVYEMSSDSARNQSRCHSSK